MFNNQAFPRYLYQKNDFTGKLEQTDAITDEALTHFKEPYGPAAEAMSKDDIFYYVYGILHSEEYRTRYANNLAKELPRIPRVASYSDFMAFAEAGRRLADLHVNYEKQPEYAGVQISGEEHGNYTVMQMAWAKIPGKKGNAAKDKTTLIYNQDITISNIPLEAQEYVVNRKSALDWLVERCCVSADSKTGIVNDFNAYAREAGGSTRYPLSLFLRVITVSLETMKIVSALPGLKIHPLDLEEVKQPVFSIV